MKKLFALTLLLLISSPIIWAQSTTQQTIEPSLKFGKPSMEELKMSRYDKDTTASAVVLYSISDAYYQYIGDDFKLYYEYRVKVKVLKSDGKSSADIIIPYYNDENYQSLKENISQLEASAYNLENGKIVRTKMDKDLVFKERFNNKYMRLKFSIPNVKVGTVFEYKYQLASDLYYNINSWDAQHDIPVIYTKHEIVIPEYFVFNLELRGRERIETKKETKALQFNVNTGGGKMETINCNGRQLTFIGHNLSALKNEENVWCLEDYRTKVDFELNGLNFPLQPYKPFTKTWKDIDKLLLEDDNFGKHLKMRNPYKEEMALLNIKETDDVEQKVGKIYSFLKNKITWDEKYALYSPEIKKAIKKGSGSNADINFILMSMLHDVNVECYPLVMSRKTNGILPITHPSIEKLNTFIVGIANTDSTMVYLDGSVNSGYINIISPSLMVDKARLIGKNEQEKWLDISQIGKNQIRGMVNAQIDLKGNITGTRTMGYMGQYAAELRHKYQMAKDSTAFIRSIESDENIAIKKFEAENIKCFSPQVKEKILFEKQAKVNGDLIYINPLIFLHADKNPYTESVRINPIELLHKEDYTVSINIKLPEGYKVEELPKPMSIKTQDGQGYCRYNIVNQGNTIMLNYSFAFNKLLYLPEEYPLIKTFWESIVEKNNEMLILKKI